MTFAILGVTGNTGKAAAEALLAKGKSVRVVVRDAAKGEAWKAKGAEVAVANVVDAAALGRAFAGAEGVYVLDPAEPGGAGLPRVPGPRDGRAGRGREAERRAARRAALVGGRAARRGHGADRGAAPHGEACSQGSTAPS